MFQRPPACPCWQPGSHRAVWMVVFVVLLLSGVVSVVPVSLLSRVTGGTSVVVLVGFFWKSQAVVDLLWLKPGRCALQAPGHTTQEIQYCVGPHTLTHTRQESSWLRHQAHFICSWSAAAWRLSKAVLSRSSLKLPEPWDYPPAVGICLPWPEFAHLYHSCRHWGEVILRFAWKFYQSWVLSQCHCHRTLAFVGPADQSHRYALASLISLEVMTSLKLSVLD